MSELLDKAIQTGIIKYVQDVFQSKKKKKSERNEEKNEEF